MSDTTGHNGFFGLNACHVAPMTDEDVPSYGSPIDVGELGGIIEIQMGAQTSTDTTYATDRAWIDSEVDNGFEGTMRIVNVWGQPTLRAAFAKFCGYDIAEDGTLLGTSNGVRQKFALMSSPSGNIEDKRTCYLACQLGKPDKNAQTREDGSNLQADEFPIVARPIKLPTGWSGSFYESYPGQDGFDDFFGAVRTDLAPSDSESTADATLSALTIGSLTLSPAFSRTKTTYVAETTGSSATITATPTDENAEVSILVGSTSVENGASASFSSGANMVTITVTNGGATKVYNVIVTKS